MSRQEFFDEIAARWDELHPVDPQRPAIRRGLERVEPLEGCAVADVGCGTGVLLHELLPRLGEGTVVAVDPSSRMLERARERFPDPRVRWLAVGALEAGLEPRSLDVVLCYNTFPHFPDRPAVLSEWSRWLKPGGRALVWHDLGRERLAEIHRRAGRQVADDLLPAPEALAALFEEAGFRPQLAEESVDSYTVLARKCVG